MCTNCEKVHAQAELKQERQGTHLRSSSSKQQLNDNKYDWPSNLDHPSSEQHGPADITRRITLIWLSIWLLFFIRTFTSVGTAAHWTPSDLPLVSDHPDLLIWVLWRESSWQNQPGHFTFQWQGDTVREFVVRQLKLWPPVVRSSFQIHSESWLISKGRHHLTSHKLGPRYYGKSRQMGDDDLWFHGFMVSWKLTLTF